MYVSHVITRLIVGGAQENTLSSVLGLKEKPGVRVDLISGPTSGAEGSLEGWVAGEPGLLTIVPELVRPIRPWVDWSAYRHLTRLYRERRPDVVHTHSGKAGLVGRLAAAQAGVPVIVHTIHGPSFGPFQGAFANFVLRAAERWAARHTDHFVVVADAMRRQYREAGIGREDQYTRVWSGFDLSPYLGARRDEALAARLGLQPGDLVIGKVARLFELKGHEDLFAAAGKLVEALPRVKFLFVGDGPWRGRFENMAREAGLADRFVFAGLVPPSEVARHVALMDILAHLSRREGLPRALPQALAAGVPVVAFDCDGAGEVCRDGETGFLIPPGNEPLLVQRLIELGRDGGLRQRLGAAGRAWVAERFTVQRMVDDLWRLYQRLLVERKENPTARRGNR